MISIIAAMTRDRVIGKDNALPGWMIPGDMKRFKALTLNKVVIMGRKTFESIGKPLPDRLNIVVSKTASLLEPRNFWIARTLEEAFVLASSMNKDDREVMVIGGGELYQQALPSANRIYLTVLDETWNGDTYFPILNMDEWNITEKESFEKHSFITLERKTTMKNENYEELGRSVGALVDVKNEAYGSAFDDAGEFLKLLYPNGIQPSQYSDALAVVRIFDKMKRIATDRDALGESPYRDIAGYGLLGLRRVERERAQKTLKKAIRVLGEKYEEAAENTEPQNNKSVG
jgi:dihydrofolate reductase